MAFGGCVSEVCWSGEDPILRFESVSLLKRHFSAFKGPNIEAHFHSASGQPHRHRQLR